jgi:hypothetical protein
MVIFGALHPQFLWAAPAWKGAVVSVISLVLAALASEVAFRGFLFQRLIDATGPATATILLSGIYAVIGSLGPNGTSLSFVVTMVAGVLFSMAYLRTHALWLGWGMHFAWAAATAVVLGLPVAGVASYSSVVQTDTTGPLWLTGGAYGPEGALFSAIVFFVAMVSVYRATRIPRLCRAVTRWMFRRPRRTRRWRRPRLRRRLRWCRLRRRPAATGQNGRRLRNRHTGRRGF